MAPNISVEERLKYMLEKVNSYEKMNFDIMNRIEIMSKVMEDDELILNPPFSGADIAAVYNGLRKEVTQLQFNSFKVKEFIANYKNLIDSSLKYISLSDELKNDCKKFE